ncbi:PepSY-like domain-containing protein [Marixanthomonas spongiae]|uniref:Putative beta-lactamase-inhibitor-like PepSY-like domain-containing protein n=1 Tax=Marixanthomonas spongiae TaxID=2174845 RepID=A0A2U0HUB0_9FLAO|nr:PepSY-like domain-containing protein [Marixanthomonas spongiae]PVW12427.1 hypothetical protein DDV96_15055 [Marixanthomonas spongiae]
MKILNLVLAALFATTIATAQDLQQSAVPSTLIANFQKEYPNATDVEWEKEMDHYKVEFDEGNFEHEIWYSASGAMVKMEQDISKNMLPSAVTNAIKNSYSSYRIDDCEKLTENNETTYKVELEKWTDEKEVVFDEAGTVVKEWNDN